MKTIKKNKFNYRASQTIAISEPSIDTQIKRLKRELNKIHETYQRKAYTILNKILTLRKMQITGYDVSDLSREKGINMSFSSITYLFGFRYLSSKTKELIEQGKLKDSTALFIIRQDTKFREPEMQNKVIKKYLDGKLNTGQISRIRSAVLLDNLETDEGISDADADLIRAVYRIADMERTLETQRNLISNGNELMKLKNHLNKLIETIDLIIKTGEKVKMPEVIMRRKRKSEWDKTLDEGNEEIEVTA